ncbi:hypothetical protein, partial [Nocardia flavorosea]|uniref:hypothetical protein n=1 Tax=Nocardia flavorosea TaxID=53429 RepID=UPI0024569409
MTDNPYPNLGYNPVPGVPDDVAGLSNRVETAAEAVRETNDLLARLRNSNDEVWRGEAGDAFRSHFDATLAQDLGYTQSSLERAVTVLGEWNTALVGFRDQAKALDQEAGVAAAEVNKAVTEVQNANANPDLGLANQVFDDPAALQAAQTRLNAATARVNAANTESPRVWCSPSFLGRMGRSCLRSTTKRPRPRLSGWSSITVTTTTASG